MIIRHMPAAMTAQQLTAYKGTVIRQIDGLASALNCPRETARTIVVDAWIRMGPQRNDDGSIPEPDTVIVRVVMLRPFTRSAISLWNTVGGHTRSSKVMNHSLGRKRAWSFRPRSPAINNQPSTLNSLP